MSDSFVYQFKITLQKSPIPVWRKIQVLSSYSFWDLHVAIQDSMGWLDYHLHQFEIINPKTGIKEMFGLPGSDYDHIDILPCWKTKIKNYFNKQNTTAMYMYDFGDDWEHKISFEGQFETELKQKYPLCIKGKNACPPEDVGGVWGYSDFLDIIENPKNSEYKEMIEWIGKDFDPYKFDASEVKFDNPKNRWKNTRGKAYG